MKNFKLDTRCGDRFETVAEKAKVIATENNTTVEFEFNDVVCIVTKDTNLKWLYKDYCNAHTMEWKQVVGVGKYPKRTRDELNRRNKLAKEESDQQRKEYDKKVKSERESYESLTKGVEIKLSDVDGWNQWRDKNKDPYGKCCFDYAESWAKLMQVEIDKGKTVRDCAEETSHQLGFYGITGFMYGAAVSILSSCWLHGEELRKWHNKEYNHEGDGVVNPAILTLKTQSI